MSDVADDGALSAVEPVPGGSGLAVRAVLKRASGLSAASVVAAAVTTPAMFLAGRWLGPNDFGRAQFVVLAYFYASLLRSGVFEGGMRTFIDLRSRGQTTQATEAEQVGYSSELAVSLVPGLALFIAAFFVSDDLRALGLLLAPAAVMASSLSAFLGGRRIARSDFSPVAKATVVRVVVAAVTLLAGIPAFGAAAVFVSPIVADVVSSIALAAQRPRLSLGLRFDLVEARSLLRVGFPLGAAAVVYWVYRTIGNASMALTGDAHAFGLYAFAAAPVAVAIRAFASLQTVFMPGLWTEMARDHDPSNWQEDGRRLTLVTAVLVAAATNLGQAAFQPLVSAVAPQFNGAVPIFEVLVFDLFVLSIAAYPSLVLDSAAANRQGLHLVIWLGALAVNVAANAIVLALGRGAVAVAGNDVWIQAVVVVVVFETAWSHIGGARHRWRFYVPLMLTAVISTCVALALHHFHSTPTSLRALPIPLLARLGGVGAVWGVVALAGRRLGQSGPWEALRI